MAAESQTGGKVPVAAPSGFFVLRTPLYPWEELEAFGDGLEAPGAADERLEDAVERDLTRLRGRLARLVARPEVREAIHVASPGLEASLPAWIRDPGGARGQKVERSLVRYLARMVGRPVPFGLFAGWSVGTVGADATALDLGPRGGYRRHTSLDAEYLCALCDALVATPAVQAALALHPNSSLYRAAGRWQYVERRCDRPGGAQKLVSVAVADTSYLSATLARAQGGARASELVLGLMASDPGIGRDEAEEFVAALLRSQVLVPDLALSITGQEPERDLVTRLRGLPGGDAAAAATALEAALAELRSLDDAGLGVPPERYQEIGRRLADVPVGVERRFQVDLRKPAPGLALGLRLGEELLRGAEILRRLAVSRRPPPEIDAMRAAFVERYGDREVRLVEILDDEGIGARAAGTGDVSPLLGGLPLPAGDSAAQTASWGAHQTHLLDLLARALGRGDREIQLDGGDLRALEAAVPLPFPDAFAVVAVVCAPSAHALAEGRFRLFLDSVTGPSGARLLGRICRADDALEAEVRRHLAAEEALAGDAVLAEVVHLPEEGHLANVVLRPCLRTHELPYLGRPSVPLDRQIPITDLLVSVVGDRFVLRSARLLREVRPRLTSAHRSGASGLFPYRFLGALEKQGVAGSLSWDWGPLDRTPFLPRIVAGRVILAPARWRLGPAERETLAAGPAATSYRAARRLREALGLPRFVAILDGEDHLPMDLGNVLCVETLAHVARTRPELTLVESMPSAEELCVRGPEGRFTHHLVVPFVRTGPPTAPARPRDHAASVTRTFPPGSEWLYAKLFTGSLAADDLLGEVVGPVAARALGTGAADQWHFLRYGEPDWHLRVRFHGSAHRLRAEVLPALEGALAPLFADGRVWRVQLDTYEREVERYGGESVDLCERIFHHDSEAVLAILASLAGDEGADLRWRLALLGIDFYLGALGLDLRARRALAREARAAYGRELRAGPELARALSDRYRRERSALEALLADPARRDALGAPEPLAALATLATRVTPLAAELAARGRTGRLPVPITEIARDLAHMHVNRLVRSAGRRHELVLYDFLARLYESRLARAR